MSDPLPIRITALAAQHIRGAKAWWRANRTAAPQAIDQELRRAFSLIASQPAVGAQTSDVELPGVRRVFLPRVKYHVYYHLVGAPGTIEVVALWHARRGHGPPI
jgi:plasmid stabilization system protein ParE